MSTDMCWLWMQTTIDAYLCDPDPNILECKEFVFSIYDQERQVKYIILKLK